MNNIVNSHILRNKLNRNASKLSSLAPILSELATRVMSRLDFIKIEPNIILDCGSGLGIDSKLLASKYSGAKVIELDIALDILKLRQPATNFFRKLFSSTYDRQYLVCANAEMLPIANKSIDFVYANLLLPYLANTQAFIKEIRRVLKLGTTFCFAGLGVDSLKELRELGLSTQVFPDMHDIGDMLLAAGFANPVVDTEYITLEYEDFSTLLADIKLIGVGPAYNICTTRYLGKKSYLKLKEKYQLPTKLTIEMFVAHGWKDQDKIDLPVGVSAITLNP